MALKAIDRPGKTRRIRTYRTFNRLLQLTLGRYLTWRYNMAAENLELFERLSPPFLVLTNHTTFWDPFMVSNFVPHPIHHVTSDANFRNPVMRFFLGLVGSIPKSKQISDLETVKHIMRIRSRSGVIGIFPEGRRSWDGHTLQLIYSTAKLIKLLRIPVVTVLMKGAYLSLPRWTRHPRRGRLLLSFRLGLSSAEIASQSVEEIYGRLTGLLEHDEYSWQRENRIPFRGRRKAERLERTLFLCPRCQTMGAMESRGDRLACRACGGAVLYNEYGFLEAQGGPPPFETVRDWNLWQIERLQALLAEARQGGPDNRIFSDGPVWLFRGYRSSPLKKLRLGDLTLYPDRAVFSPRQGRRIHFPLNEMSGVNIQNRERLELYLSNTLYRFLFIDPRVSAYKWMLSMNVLRGLSPQDISFQA